MANAPRGAATKAIAGPAPLHVAASTSLAMLRIVPSPRIAPCDENWNRMHRPMETSVLGVCERSDIVAVTNLCMSFALGKKNISTVDGSGLVYVCILRTDLFANRFPVHFSLCDNSTVL